MTATEKLSLKRLTRLQLAEKLATSLRPAHAQGIPKSVLGV